MPLVFKNEMGIMDDNVIPDKTKCKSYKVRLEISYSHFDQTV